MLRYVIIIEEAHNIVGRSGDATPSEDFANPKAHACEFVCRMLAELRGPGVGIVIIDQLPSAVAPEVIKNTATKLALRQVANEDREELGGTMLFSDIEMQDIARLQIGDAFFFTEGYYGPRRIKTVNLHQQLNFGAPVSDEELAKHIQCEKWFQQAALTRQRSELAQLKEYMDAFDDKRIRIAGSAKCLLADYQSLLDHVVSGQSQTQEVAVIRQARMLRSQLIGSYRSFRKGPYRAYLSNGVESPGANRKTEALRESLIQRFESVIEPDVNSLLGVIDRLIRNCIKFTEQGE